MAPLTEAEHHLRGVERMLDFAIEHKHSVLLEYVDVAGDRSTRVVEPHVIERTLGGKQIVRALDLKSGDYRSFRIDRILDLAIRPDGFTGGQRTAEQAATGEAAPGVLVEYHGTKRGLHGVLTIHGPCPCRDHDGPRWSLAWRSNGHVVLDCVRPRSIRVIDSDEADEIEAFVRVRLDIADVDPNGFERPQMRWTPDCPASL